jgi:hypothetical protein
VKAVAAAVTAVADAADLVVKAAADIAANSTLC